MSGADSDALLIENCAYVVGVNIIQDERNDRGLVFGRPDDPQTVYLRERECRVIKQFGLIRGNVTEVTSFT